MKKLNFEVIKKIDYILIFLLAVFVIITLSVKTCKSNIKVDSIFIPQNLDEGIISYITENQIGDYEYPLLLIRNDIPKENLLHILDYYYLNMQLNQINIYNHNVTKTLNGQPYKKQWAQIDSSGVITVQNDDNFKLVYDPDHPDAIKDNCPEKGYVRYPEINIEWELSELNRNVDLYNTFVSYGNKVYPSVLLEKINNNFDELLKQQYGKQKF